jgi:glycosyltransferase involved in cell wall biosynthesis
VLSSLRAQTLALDQWELLLVDNASEAPLDTKFDLGWHPRGMHVREARLGLTPARLRGIAESTGGFIVLVDDDNVLAPDYLSVCQAIAVTHPHVGAWGGSIRPEYEAEPEQWVNEFLPYLAVRNVERDLWSNAIAHLDVAPCGAGMAVRRAVALEYARYCFTQPERSRLDRCGQNLISAGDTDLALVACDLGMGMGLFRALSLTHLIPPQRLTEDYLVRLVEGIESSGYLMQFLRKGRCDVPKASLRSRLAEFRRWLTLSRRQWRFHRARMRARRVGLMLQQSSSFDDCLRRLGIGPG